MKKIFCCVLFCFLLVISGCGKSQKIEDISKYGQFESDFRMGTDLLPIEVEPQAVNDYQYVCDEGLFSSEQQIFLDCSYDKQTFQQECRRLQNSKNVIYDETCFSYPAYILCLGDLETSHYVLVDESHNRMIYVYLQLAEIDDIVFPKDYLPYGYRDFGDCDYTYQTMFLESGEQTTLEKNDVISTPISYYTTEISKYHQFVHDDEMTEKDLAMFPKEISGNMKLNDYLYTFSTSHVRNHYLKIRADISMDEREYEKEKLRLQSIASYNEKDFEYPAYVVEDTKNAKGYVLCIEEDYRMVYDFSEGKE